MSIDLILVWTALLLLVSVLASKVSAYLGVPALLFFLGIGMLAGSEGPGGIYFDDPWASQLLGVVALAFILFAGGLDTRWEDVRPVLGMGLALSTAGVLITALLVGGCAMLLLDFSFQHALLLGAIVSSTDAAAVFAVLRGRSIGLQPPLRPLLELESGSNDPMAVFLMLGMLRLLDHSADSPLALLPFFAQQMGIGAVAGTVVGRLMARIINRLRLESDGLYPVLTIALVLLLYAATAALGGNGFLAVYVAGVLLARANFVHKASLRRFHEGLAWLMQIAMFLTLGLLVFPSELAPISAEGLLVALFLMLVARPISVFVTLAWARIALRQKLFVAWVGLRGAAPIVLATFPLLAGLPEASTVFNLVFFIVLMSVLVQGTTLSAVARWLRVDLPLVVRPAPPVEFTPPPSLRSELVELVVPEHSALAGKALVDAGLPEGTLVVLVGRGESFLVPTGSTILEAGDVLLLLADTDCLSRVRTLIAAPDHSAKPSM